MIENIVYIILAILGLGFIVFIHELGHYLMARRVGMRVEIFSIGFGKPIYSWHHKGVKWQLAILPFGGYVKIAGMGEEKGKDPLKIPDGFFGKRPIDRIKVGVMGPLFNFLLAIAAFSAIYLLGGRDQPFNQYTQHIGWVDPSSELFRLGVRPGDQIFEYGKNPFTGLEDLQYTSVVAKNSLQIKGERIDYFKGTTHDFSYTLPTYEDRATPLKGSKTLGITSLAQYLFYHPIDTSKQERFYDHPPILDSGIEPNDRLLWMEGELLFSIDQLVSQVNQSTAYLTIKRNHQILHSRMPRIKTRDLKIGAQDRNELDDMMHEAKIKSRIQDLYVLPYAVSENLLVESSYEWIDPSPWQTLLSQERKGAFLPLQRGDKILAVNGTPVRTMADIYSILQNREVLFIVQRDPALFMEKTSWKKADALFNELVNKDDLNALIQSIGTDKPLEKVNNLYLLKPVTPKTTQELVHTPEQKALYNKYMEQLQQPIAKIQDPIKREEAYNELDKMQKRLLLGFSYGELKDLTIRYNPNPFVLFVEVFKKTYNTLFSLVTGALHPRWIMGPVGIIQVVQHGWSLGIIQALFIFGLISVNLGFINLLPIPALDGGHIVFALIEMVTRKRIKIKTMEKLIMPFFILLMVAFILLTYQDLMRIFSRFFH